ncbi:MAG: hypothetical protein K2N51_10840 [Lachnospiraceae bacterium]|nr:hypothetical protein [Lachnospiraceae bacterium]
MTEKKETAQQTEKKWVNFEDLTLCNNFMFGEVVADGNSSGRSAHLLCRP